MVLNQAGFDSVWRHRWWWLGTGVATSCSVSRTGILLTVLQCSGQPPNTKRFGPHVSIALRPGEPGQVGEEAEPPSSDFLKPEAHFRLDRRLHLNPSLADCNLCSSSKLFHGLNIKIKKLKLKNENIKNNFAPNFRSWAWMPRPAPTAAGLALSIELWWTREAPGRTARAG